MQFNNVEIIKLDKEIKRHYGDNDNAFTTDQCRNNSANMRRALIDEEEKDPDECECKKSSNEDSIRDMINEGIAKDAKSTKLNSNALQFNRSLSSKEKVITHEK